MSLLAYLPCTRLWWNGSKGIAECDGVCRPLKEPPHVPGLEYVEIDCAADVHCYRIRRHKYDREEDMESREVEAVKRWLHCFANGVKRELGM